MQRSRSRRRIDVPSCLDPMGRSFLVPLPVGRRFDFARAGNRPGIFVAGDLAGARGLRDLLLQLHAYVAFRAFGAGGVGTIGGLRCRAT